MAGLITDANGNLFGTTSGGGANGEGTVFEIIKTADGYANTPTILVSFCALAGCADGADPNGLIADAHGNLHTLWEYNPANPAAPWSELSTGSFVQISGASTASRVRCIA